MNIGGLVYDATVRGDFALIARNPMAQFGTATREYVGASILPRQRRTKNAYTERGISFRTVIANSGARHGSAQRKGGARVGAMDVRTANSDIQAVLDSEEYDALIELLDNGADMAAMASIVNFVDISVNLALEELVEAQRWQAIVNASVVRKGNNGYTETVTYPTFAGLRAAVATDWSVDTNDPMLDIMAMARALRKRGRRINRIFMAETDLETLMKNAKIQSRLGGVVISATGQIQGQPGFVTPEMLNRYFISQNLPMIETYDLQYNTETGAGYFLPRGAMVFVSTTGRNQNIDLGNGVFFPLDNTVGYVADGRPVGQPDPGKVIQVKFYEDKPPRLVSEGWQDTMTVITEPDAIAVLTGIVQVP